MKKMITVGIAALLLSGCANRLVVGVDETTPQVAVDNTHKVFVGIPAFLSLEGSVSRLDSEWMVTAAHNAPLLKAQLKDVFYHPKCDIALYRDRDDSFDGQVGKVYPNQNVYHVGYPTGMPMVSSLGQYAFDVSDPSDGCVYSATTSGVISGMSGGGVYNEKGELLGVTRGFISETITFNGITVEDPAVFYSLLAVSDWLYEITGKKYFD